MLVSSSRDIGERYTPGDIDPPPASSPALPVPPEAGSRRSTARVPSGPPRRSPGPPVDAYGAGDCFAAGLTYGPAAGRSPEEALTIGAQCGAACVTGSGPLHGKLRDSG